MPIPAVLSIINPWTATLVPFIISELSREAGAVDADAQAVWLALANEFIAVDLADVAPKTVVLDIDSLTLSDGSIMIPSNVVSIKSVYCGNLPVARTSRAALDDEFPGWQSAAGLDYAAYWFAEDKIYTYPALSSLDVIEVTVESKIPLFAAGDVIDSPMQYLPTGYELLAAYYVLSELAWDTDHAAQVSRYQRNNAKLEKMKAKLLDAMEHIALADFTF